MTIPRQTPHRATRPDRAARERADLKREKRRLERTVARLSEELEKTKDTRPRKPRPAKAVPAVPAPEPEGKRTGNVCMTCGCDDCRKVELGPHGDFMVCPVCKSRRRLTPRNPSDALL